MSCTQATSIRAAYPREATREELSDIIERAVKSEKEELLKSLVEEVEGMKKEIRYEELDTGIGIDRLEYDGQEKEHAFNYALQDVIKLLERGNEYD